MTRVVPFTLKPDPGYLPVMNGFEAGSAFILWSVGIDVNYSEVAPI